MEPTTREPFSVATGLHGTVVIVRLSGELDLATAPDLRTGLAQALTLFAPPKVVLDVEALTFCDSTGLLSHFRIASTVEAAVATFG